MATKNERTSARVAKIAGRVLRYVKLNPTTAVCVVITRSELKALCASALTQAPDKPKKAKRG